MKLRPFLVLLTIAGLFSLGSAACNSPDRRDNSVSASEQSQDAFKVVASVLRHPRCLNCHTNTDFVRVGDERMPHRMNVLRGANNKGVPGMRCSSCHQAENQNEVGVPGAPHWSAAPLSMGWEGLDDRSLAMALLDTKQNGNRTLADLSKHMSTDPLVLWGWNPGEGREQPPVDHDAFVAAFEAWIQNGAVLPPAGQTTR